MRIDPTTDILIVVDVQYDFCPGGALEVPEGDAVVPVINRVMDRFSHIVLTQDWHPPDHSSFASQHNGRQPFETVEMPYGTQVLWPDHCVQGSHGADFHSDLRTNRAELIVRKGYRRAIDSYSAFLENDHETPTGLTGALRDRGIGRVFLCGLATDFCVGFSAQDARKMGFDTVLVEDACRGIDLDGSLAQAKQAMEEAGVLFTDSDLLA